MEWYIYENGKTIGKTGSENGSIIEDIGNVNGARITLEKDGAIAPFAITFGIHGLLVHTHFEHDEIKAKIYIDEVKQKMEVFFTRLESEEGINNIEWKDYYNQVLSGLVD